MIVFCQSGWKPDFPPRRACVAQVKSHLQKHRLKEARRRRAAQAAAPEDLLQADAAAASLQHVGPDACQQGSTSPTTISAVPVVHAGPAKRHKAQHSPLETSSPVARALLAPPSQPAPGQVLQQLFWLTADAAQAAGVPGLCSASTGALPLVVPARDIPRRASPPPASAACSPSPLQLLATARSGSCSSTGVHMNLQQLLLAQWEISCSTPGPSSLPLTAPSGVAAVPTAALQQIGTAANRGHPTISSAPTDCCARQPSGGKPPLPSQQLQQPSSPFDACAFLNEEDVDFLLNLK